MTTGNALILTVAKNDENLSLLGDLLDERGYDPRTVNSLAEFEQAVSAGPSVDLAVVDVDGLSRDVWAYCDELDEQGVPILAMTGTRPDATRREGREHGVRVVLEKPTGPAELTEAIQSLVERG